MNMKISMRHLLSFVLLIENVLCERQDHRRPIWNIAHMVNAWYQVDYYLGQGANSIEFDIAFDSDGTPRYTFHGIPCDCFRSCTKYESFDVYLDYVRQLTFRDDPSFKEKLVLLVMDLKVNSLGPTAQYRAGVNIANKLLEHYWKKGSAGSAYILISLPSVNNIEVIRGIKRTIKDEDFEKLMGFDISGNEDLELINKRLESAGVRDKVWQGDGITNCLPRGSSRLYAAMNLRDENSYLQKVYWWTVDKMSTMRRIISMGVDGVITNHPERLVEVLKEFSTTVRLATIEDNPWKRFVPKISSRLRMGSVGNFSEEEEILYNI